MRELLFSDGHGFVATAVLGDTSTKLRRLDGWYGGSSVNTEDVQRLTDGAVPATMRRGARRIVLGLQEFFPTRDEAVLRQREISGVYMAEDDNRIGDGTLTVHNEEGTLSAYGVALDDTPRIASKLGAKMVDWELTLRAPDSRLYAAAQRAMITSAGVGVGLRFPLFQPGYLDFGAEVQPPTAFLVNEGNAVAYPTFVVQGDFPGGFRIVLLGDVPSGALVEFQGSVTTGDSVTVDVLRGAISVNGVDQSWAITRSLWAGAAPGGSLGAKLEALTDGQGHAAMELRSTYM